MALWKIVTLLCAATLYAEAKWNHHQKREIKPSICDPGYNKTNKVQCYCVKDIRDPAVVRSADCYLTTEGVGEDDMIWNEFKILKSAHKLTLSNSRGITLKYIPKKIFNETIELQKVDIKYGLIEKVVAFAFANLSTLEDITLRDNQISVLEQNAFAHHRDLTIISLDTNKIIEINRDVFVDLPSLEKLYLTSNKITTIHDKAFLHLSNLRELEIDRNGLFSLNSETFSGLKKLQKLDLSSNSLEVIGDNTFLPLVNLLSLNLGGNKIQMLDDRAFNGLVKLQSMSLAHNKLADIDNVKVFEGLEGLVSLSLRANQLKQLKPEVMAPILTNLQGNMSSLDVEDNNFPCSCSLDWFIISLLNKTQNNHLKIAIENLKCLPDASLREAWAKTDETDKNTGQVFEDEESQLQNADYEYYDDTQLNGRLFYIDVRDLLNCTNSSKRHTPVTAATSKTPVPSTKVTKATSSPTTVKPKIETTEITKEINNVNNIVKANPKAAKGDFTTTKLATVSSNPIDNNLYDQDMASDDPKPDKIKAHRSVQDINDVPNARPNSAINNVGCVTLVLLCSRLSFY
ncbi:connectin [Manduca sexta]|uniref:Connectin n=1 Tax=Manduca sexta TaxID=7130 RepID=A0A921ZLZ8_MANSE|nr:connectin [Manduca sexta]KAG6460001.1 hypothetical protein O3G_MSEX011708 [Manduca sexta]